MRATIARLLFTDLRAWRLRSTRAQVGGSSCYITKCPSPFRTTAESLEADVRTIRAMQRTLACLGSES